METTHKKKRGIASWVGRILLGLLVLVVAIVGFGLAREAWTRNGHHAQFPAPGEMVSIDNHEIHLNCVGEGSPTVVFEADLDQYGSTSWNSVQGDIGEVTRACSYDRAGIMWSEPGPLPRDGASIASELKAVLDAAGEEGPYVLVGHAFGGAYVRIFAGMNPDEVAGMVLVESSHPDMLTTFADYGVKPEIPEASLRPVIWLLSHLGNPSRNQVSQAGPTSELDEIINAFLPESSLAWYDEKVESPTTLEQSGKYQDLGDIPLIVVATSRPANLEGNLGEQLDEAWIEMQRDLLSLSSNSELRVYEGGGHYPQLQDPEQVIDAILDLLADL